MNQNQNKILESIVLISALIFILLSVFILKPTINPMSDSPSYINAIKVLDGGDIPSDFTPNRILTTFIGLKSISLLSKIVGNIQVSWFIVNSALYTLIAVAFYRLTERLFKDRVTALFSTIFLISNYAIINFGLGFYMDIGGWAFYIFSLYFLNLYLESKNYKMILLSAIMVGIGGLWKEYAFLGIIPVFCLLIYENWPDIAKLLRRSVLPALIVLLPSIFLHYLVYEKFGYSYVVWFSQNMSTYHYHSRITEYIKSGGSLLNFLTVPLLVGTYFFLKEGKNIMPKTEDRVFVYFTVLSFLPILLWPAITQRILFIAVPAVILVSGFAFRRFNKMWPAFLLILVLYVVANFLMDSVILPYTNLPF